MDERGVPGCFVVTTEFRDAAASQSRSLGFEPAIVWVSHPIQNRSPQELKEIATKAIEPILTMITKSL